MKNIIFACSFIIGLYCYGQKNIEISLQQDLRLFTLGDEKGNDPLTINLLSRIEIPIYNFKKNYLTTYISGEYADLVEKNYQRYAIGLGYVIKSLYRKIGAGAYIDFGKIYRNKESFYSFSLSGELRYKINDKLQFICTSQLTQRKDLSELYNSKKGSIISGFVGFKYGL
jgi:hypothetical protein